MMKINKWLIRFTCQFFFIFIMSVIKIHSNSRITDLELVTKLKQTTSVAEQNPLYFTVGRWFILDSLRLEAVKTGCRTIDQRSTRLVQRFSMLNPLHIFVVLREFRGGAKGKGKPALHIFMCRTYTTSPGRSGVRKLLPVAECKLYRYTTTAVINAFFTIDGNISPGIEELIRLNGIPEVGSSPVTFYDKVDKGVFTCIYALPVKCDEKTGKVNIETPVSKFLKKHYFKKGKNAE